jgi:hypothetical protein
LTSIIQNKCEPEDRLCKRKKKEKKLNKNDWKNSERLIESDYTKTQDCIERSETLVFSKKKKNASSVKKK